MNYFSFALLAICCLGIWSVGANSDPMQNSCRKTIQRSPIGCIKKRAGKRKLCWTSNTSRIAGPERILAHLCLLVVRPQRHTKKRAILQVHPRETGQIR